jgi:uncharacterized protein (DUF433 family)
LYYIRYDEDAMSAQPVSLRIPPEARRSIEEIARRTGRDFSSVANEMLSEAVKMRCIPGITFTDSASGRVARLAGRNTKVFEIVAALRAVNGDRERLRQGYAWLSEQELRAALAYAEAYPDEIAVRLRQDEAWSADTVWSAYPFTRPRDQ